MAGIGAAQTLRAAGVRVVVFEKSPSFGGRCATRNWEGDLVDHGAQYFTVGSSSFARAVRKVAGNEVHAIGGLLLRPNRVRFPERKRYYHRGGMKQLARLLAGGLDVRTKVQVPPLNRGEEGWLVEGETFGHVLSTAPLPQTVALFGAAPAEDVGYEPCLTLLLRYWGEWLGRTSRVYGMEHAPGSALRWSACENYKAGHIQPGRTVMVAHAGAAFSREFWDADPAEWGARLRAELEAAWQIAPAHFDGQFTHRWRFARVLRALPAPLLPENAWHAGDGVCESRVESAWLNGCTAAEKLLYRLG